MNSKYFLITKLNGIKYSDYQGSAQIISETIPHSVDVVWVGIKKQPNKIRKITTFKDYAGDIIERSFDYSDGKIRNRVYTNRVLKIRDNEKVSTTVIKDYYINKKMLPHYNQMMEEFSEVHPLKKILWNLTKIITNHLSINTKNGNKILSQTNILNMQTPTKQKHSFIEFPQIKNNKIQNRKPKILSFTVNGLTNKIKSGSIYCQNTQIPENDSFLAQRALPIYDSKEVFANKFLKERKLTKAEIFVEPDYYPKNEDEKLYAADFNPENGSINFNRFFKPYSKAETAKIAKHEVEHGWQYYLRSRITIPSTEWERFISLTFGKIKNKKLKTEGIKYTKSILNYTNYTKELEEKGQLNKYLDNFIEKIANKNAKKVKNIYNKEGKVIRNNFKHIPKEYL